METNITFLQIALNWIEAKRPLVKESTICAYTLIIHTHLLQRFADAVSITEAEVQTFVLEKLTSGLSRKSVKDILALLRAIVNHGGKHFGFPRENWDIAFPTDTGGKSLPVLSIAHHRKLLRHLTASPSTQNIGILIALCTGMRIGEICALTWNHTDLRHREITVSQTLGRVYDVGTKTTRRVLSSPKTKHSNRVIPISHELYTALSTLKRTYPKSLYVVGCGSSPKEPRTYREYFTRLIARLGIPKIVFHGLRHTFATRCIECMCDYKTVSAILGHSNVATTMNLYVHPNQNQKKKCINKLTKFINPKDYSSTSNT